MASTNFTNQATLTDAAWFDDVDTVVYGALTSVAGTDTITATGPTSMTGYASGQLFRFIPANTNTGATTINISSLGAKDIRWNNAACSGGELVANVPVLIMYDGTRFHIMTSASAQGVPSGTLLDFAGTSAPTGYLACDGSAVSRTTYAALFAAISTTWGAGNGTTTFNLPDFRRRVSVGSGGSGTGTLGNAVGNTGGAETHALVSGELAAHTHTGPSHTHTFTTGGVSADHTHGGFYARASGGAADYSTGGGGSADSGGVTNTGGASADHTHSGTTAADGTGATGSTGSGTAHNNMQPSAVVLKIIKT